MRKRAGWNLGAITGAVTSVGIVWLYASGHIPWGWLMVTSPLVILGGICGAALHAQRDGHHGEST